MTYALIGSGNMAWLVASRMFAAGHTCVGVWGRNAAAVDSLCEAFSLLRIDSLKDFNDGPDACIVAVADSAIAEVVKPLSMRSTVLIHTAGSVSIDILTAHSKAAGVVWPVYSIRKAALPQHRAFSALIEANNREAWQVVRGVAKAICDTPYEATSAQRQWMHLAAVMGNNFVNHLLSTATDICAVQGLPISLLHPLLEQTIAGARTQHPALLQTGPARRHDAATITKHLAMLEAHPEWKDLYTTFTKAIMEKPPLPSSD